MRRSSRSRPASVSKPSPRLSVTDLAVLGVLAEGPSHGFALSKELDSGSDVGRVYSIQRPLVYRALDHLVECRYAEPVATEKGDAGPQRVIHHITPRGKRRLEGWLVEPVAHIRDIRIVLLLKLTLLSRSGHSPVDLIRRQRTALESTLTALGEVERVDHVELWRRHNAKAATIFLDDLEKLYTG